jgi:hypothetical protein
MLSAKQCGLETNSSTTQFAVSFLCTCFHLDSVKDLFEWMDFKWMHVVHKMLLRSTEYIPSNSCDNFPSQKQANTTMIQQFL